MPLKTIDNLYVTEIFSSIQGESTYVGYPTTFIRLSGCNLRCSWCDTPYSFQKGKCLSVDEILSTAKENALKYVCITGGEPLLQSNVYVLMRMLLDAGHIVSIETGGSLSIEMIDSRVKIILDIKCPKSEMEHKNDWKNLERLKPIDEIKFVIQDKQDYDYAKKICRTYCLFDKQHTILFSPVHELLDPKPLISWILKDKLPVKLNLQQHKYIWSSKTRGV